MPNVAARNAGVDQRERDDGEGLDVAAVSPPSGATTIDPMLREALLRELSAAPDGVSLPRLIKRLRVRMSVLMRALAWLGDDVIGTQRGEGLVRVEQRGETQIARLATDASRDDAFR